MTTKDDLLIQCWKIFDYWASSYYQGAMDEQYTRMINKMFGMLSEIGRPEPKFDSFGKPYYIPEEDNE